MKRLTPDNITKNQHYVWRHYLEAWEIKGSLFCFRKKTKRVDPSKALNVGRERYTYAVERLTEGDLKYLDVVIEQFATDELKELAKGWIDVFQMSFSMKDFVDTLDNLPIESRKNIEEYLRYTEKMTGEFFNGKIEDNAQIFLRDLKTLDASFLEKVNVRSDFFFFVAIQYFRTIRMRRPFLQTLKIGGHDPARTAFIESVIFATNVGACMIAEKFGPVFLENNSNVPFITCDQPIINLLGHQGGDDGKSMELYYPLSPYIAIILKKYTDGSERRQISSIGVEGYNYMMLNEYDQELYANERAYLESLSQLGKL